MSTAKRKLEVGDRVRAYGRQWDQGVGFIDIVGTISAFVAGEALVNTGDRVICCHPKQCRRLVKKERRRVWIRGLDLHTRSATPVVAYQKVDRDADFVEFVEVRK